MKYDTAVGKLTGNSQLKAARRMWGTVTYICRVDGQMMIVEDGDPAKVFTPAVRERKAGDWRVF